MLHYPRRDLTKLFDSERVFYGQGRGESGICLHVPFKGYIAGSAPTEEHLIMLTLANDLIEFLRYKRATRGPEVWDYDPEKAAEAYAVCGDNLSSSGLVILDTSYAGGPKIQIFLDKTFGANEVAILWKNQMVGDDRLLNDYEMHLKETLSNGKQEQEAG
jgi:hypothetical protein